VSAEPKAGHDVDKALEEALAERNRLWAQLNEQRVDQRELEYLRRELKMIHGSTWWKLAGRYQRIKQLSRAGLQRLRNG
jgi:hypothetical protein